MSSQATGFLVAAFAFDGQLEGTGFREIANLSSKWLTICREHLATTGTRSTFHGLERCRISAPGSRQAPA